MAKALSREALLSLEQWDRMFLEINTTVYLCEFPKAPTPGGSDYCGAYAVAYLGKGNRHLKGFESDKYEPWLCTRHLKKIVKLNDTIDMSYVKAYTFKAAEILSKYWKHLSVAHV